MRYIALIILTGLLLSCGEPKPNVNFDIEIGFLNDTLYEYQQLRHYFSYPNLKIINSKDSILKADVIGFGDCDLLKYFKEDSIVFGTLSFHNCEEFQMSSESAVFDSLSLKFAFHLQTVSGIDTTFNHQLKFLFDCSDDSPVAEGKLNHMGRTGRWLFYNSPEKRDILAITHYDEQGLKQGVDSIYYNYNKGKLQEILTWRDGKKNGFRQSFSKTTSQPLIFGNYKNGEKEGLWLNVGYRGQLYTITKYHNGIEQKSINVFDQNIKYNDSTSLDSLFKRLQ